MSSFGAFGGGPTFTNFGGSNNQQSSDLFGQYYDLVQNSGGSGNAPPGYSYNAATGMNQKRVGGSFQNPFGGVTFQRYDGPFGPTGMAQYQGAALADLGKMENATQQNYQNFMGAADAYRAAITGGAEDIRQAGTQGRDLLFDFSKGLALQGQNIYSDIEGRVDQAIEGYEDLSTQQASAVSAGLLAQNRTQRQQIDSAAKMGDPNAIAAAHKFELENDIKQAQTMTQLATSYNQGLAGMRMQGAQTMIGAGGIQANYDQMASGVYQMGVSIEQAAVAQAANFEAQGLGTYAQMIAANPFNPVAFLPTLMSFFQFTETPGSDSFQGFNPDFLGMSYA